ncbi:MAG TPA: FAD/NAD(P)-binding protein [Chthoniobacterales bacterium]|nr:FAD/NAD(P)-binding protein [Chthoniobacterales bacterium]
MHSPLHPDSVDVAIVGAGFSGTMGAVHLLKHTVSPVTVALIERTAEFAKGVAYRTRDISHRLNVPAAKMGAFPEDVEGFYRWLQSHPERLREVGVRSLHPGAFVPRVLFGEYLADLLADAEKRSTRLRKISSEAIDLVPLLNGAFRVEFSTARPLIADQVVLALGNFPPGDPGIKNRAFHQSDRYLVDPWSAETRSKLSGPGDVLILGSGLTALDLLLSLSHSKPSGKIHVLSRRGLFPRPHLPVEPFSAFIDPDHLPSSIRSLCRMIRREIQRANENGKDWRAVIDSIRPFSQSIWKALSRDDQRRFLRHLRTFWEPHRHRVAPEVLMIKESLETKGRLCCYRGRVVTIEEETNGLAISFYRNRESQTLHVSYVINCTGPECNYHKLKDPLIVQLFARGLIVPDPLFLGLDVSDGGTILNLVGERVKNLYTLGSPQKGILLETTAVPEIRVQARDLASRILQQYRIQGRIEQEDFVPDPAYAYQI